MRKHQAGSFSASRPASGRSAPEGPVTGGPGALRGAWLTGGVDGGVVGELAALARGLGGREAQVLAERADGVVVRSGRLVAKAHAGDTDTAALAVRVRIAAHPVLAGVLLAPVAGPDAGHRAAGRVATVWPYGEPVDREDPDAAPWEEAAVLLARLHRLGTGGLPGPVPPMRGPAKVAGALDRLEAGGGGSAAAAVVRKAAGGLPGWARGRAVPPPSDTVVHGDLHLGQLVRCPGTGEWRLIDVDDLGLGDPAWDLARPAAWFAIGLLAPEVWERFLSAYRAAGGPAVPAEGDPWAALDVPARALTVQSAALAVVRAGREGRAPDEVDEALVDACGRIAGIAHEGVVS